MRRVALQEVATINPRASKHLLLEDSPVSFVPMAAVSEMSRKIERVEVRQYSEVSKGYTYFEEGDVIVAKITPCYENGKIALATNLPHRVAFGSTEFHVFRAGDDTYNRYIFHLLQAPKVRVAGASQMKGAAGQKRVPAEYFKALQIPHPPLPEQKRIVAILDAADALRAKRRESLVQLDTLLQSTFLDMFGDPVTNPKGWDVKPLGEIIKVKSGNGLVAKDMALNGQYPVYGGNGINGYHDTYMFDEPKIVLGRVGVYCGAVHLTESKAWVTDNALYVHELLKTIDTTYLFFALKMANLNQYAGRAAQPLISGSRIYPVTILFPGLEHQRRYAMVVESIEQQKTRLLEHLAELDTLFASLQQRAFNGEL